MKKFLSTLLLSIVATTVTAGSLTTYMSAPGFQMSSGSGINFTTENFNSVPNSSLGSSGTFATGSWTSTGAVGVAASQYGGACSTATLSDTAATSCSLADRTNYLRISANNSMTINLTNPSNYVGFWWAQGDANNTIEFYDQGNNLLASFTTSALTTALSGPTISTVGGGTNTSSDYTGTRTNGTVYSSERYAYINLLLSGTATRFTKIIIKQGVSGGFELDNLTTGVALPTVDPSWAQISQQNTTDYYTIGGTVSGLGTGTLVLQNNGGNNTTVNANGNFTIGSTVVSGANYAVTVGTQPTGQICTVTNGTGTATGNVTNVSVTCVSTYTIGGTVTGLATGQTLSVLNNSGNSTIVSANGSFTFSTPINSGGTYAVTVGTQPSAQTCTVANGSGTASANVTNVTVTCTTNAVAPIPTLSEWAMIFLASLMAMFAIYRTRRQ